MKHLILSIIALIAYSQTIAQSLSINLNENYVTQLLFDNDVLFARFANPDDFAEPQLHQRIILVQPLGAFVASNLSVICTDGSTYSLRLTYSKNIDTESYYIQSQSAIGKGGISSEGSLVDKPTQDDVIKRIIAEPGYIQNRNTVKNKKAYLSLTGIYTKQEKIYLRLEINNTSEIPFNLETFTFSLSPKIGKYKTSASEQSLKSTEVYLTNKNNKIECIYEFSKFTIGNEYLLNIECIENGGARNMTFQISEDLFLNAKTI